MEQNTATISEPDRAMKLSVITTVYNAEPYLRESLDSLVNQTFRDFEVIFVNDGCTDGCRDILIEYAQHSNVRLLENRYNEGVPISSNRALLTATGEYVAIHDADDVSMPHRFEREIEYLDSHPEITFMGTHATKISHTGDPIGSYTYPPETTEEAFKLIIKNKLNPIINPSCMFRRQPIVDNGGYSLDPDIRTVMDLELWCRLLVKNHLMANIQEPLINYRINSQGITRSERDVMVQATDVVWASFRRKLFVDPVLRPDLFMQDSYTEFTN